MKKRIHYCSLFFFLSLLLLSSACTIIYKGTGNTLVSYAEDEGVPYMLGTGDVTLGCSMVESFAPFLLSFSRVTTSPDKLAIMFYLVAGSCTEFKAWEEELRYFRAIYSKKPIEAQDARITQQRFLNQAARRQLIGYDFLASAYLEPGEECPVFAMDRDELYWLMGLINGLQAVINDIASGGHVQVPLGLAAKIGRGAACLNNEKWWGVPEAIQAAIWISIPTSQSSNKDPMQILLNSMQLGAQQGVIITHVLAAQVYLGLGHTEKIKQIIRDSSRLVLETPDSQEYKILNQVSKLQIQQFSDRLWTESTGKRTPLGKLGSFWDDPAELVDVIDIGDIL